MRPDLRLRTLHWETQPRWLPWGRQGWGWMTTLGVLLAALAMLGLIWALWSWSQLTRQTEALQAGNSQLRMAQFAPATREAASRSAVRSGVGLVPGQTLSTEQRQALQSVVRQLNFPWQALFEQLERSTPADVALISVEPDGQRATVRLQAEARSYDTLLRYAAALQGQGVLGKLSYSKHETNDRDMSRPARLTIEIELLSVQQAAQSNAGKVL